MSESGPGAATQADDFVDLICADPSLLRAQFDALVRASWDSEPPTSPPRKKTLVGLVEPDRDQQRFLSGPDPVVRPRSLRYDAEVHQRSPPGWSG